MYYVFYDYISFLTYIVVCINIIFITINISSFLMFLMVLSLLSLCFKFLHRATILKFWPYVLNKRFEQFLKWTVSKMYTVQSKDIKIIQWCSFNVFDVNFQQCLLFNLLFWWSSFELMLLYFDFKIYYLSIFSIRLI